jgi:hypothetical protein
MNKTKEYTGHFTPLGASVGAWKFHYTGWTSDAFDKETYVNGNASYNNLKPEKRQSLLKD